MRDGRCDAENVLHIVKRRAIVHDFGFRRRRGSLRQRCQRQNQGESQEMNTHDGPPPLTNAVQHTREAESIDSRACQQMLPCLLFSSRGHKSKRAYAITYCFAGAKRDLSFVRDWSEERSGRRNQVVRGGRIGRQTAEGWRLLAHEIGRRDSAAGAHAGEKVSEADVAAARPDVMVLAWAATGTKSDPKQAYKVAAWKDVPAIQNRNVHVISDEMLNTPGPPLVEGAQALYKLLHRVNGMREHG